MNKYKGKYKREAIWCVRCKSEGYDKEHFPIFYEYLASEAPSPLKSPYPGVRYAEIDITLVSVVTYKNMFKHPQICISNYVSLWGMMIGIVGIMTSCMKGRETYTKFKAKCNKKETLRNITPLGEENSTLAVDSEEEEEKEVWVKNKDRSSITTVHNQDTSTRTLALLVAIATHLNMLMKIVLCC
jgi:hypothetical protein